MLHTRLVTLHPRRRALSLSAREAVGLPALLQHEEPKDGLWQFENADEIAVSTDTFTPKPRSRALTLYPPLELLP